MSFKIDLVLIGLAGIGSPLINVSFSPNTCLDVSPGSSLTEKCHLVRFEYGQIVNKKNVLHIFKDVWFIKVEILFSVPYQCKQGNSQDIGI